MSREISFREFSEINLQRCRRWHPGFPGDDGWSGADWANAMQGEAGEAGNVVKKLRRIETDMRSLGNHRERDDLLADLADEIGDVYAYLDLLAQFYGLDIETCVVEKFNKISNRENLPERVGDS
jgi:NTP pyrophosphatase (non-canonical NTP hydrolase)